MRINVDSYNVGDEIQAHFNVSGRLWSGNGKPEKCSTSLQAWKIDSVSAATTSTEYTLPYTDSDVPGTANNSFDDDIGFRGHPIFLPML